MKSRRRFFFMDKSALSIIALTTVLLAAFQNCGELRSNSASGSDSGYGSASLEDAEISFSKAEFVLTESASAGAADTVTLSLKPGAGSSRVSYQLMQSEANGMTTATTVLGTLDGSALLSEAFSTTEIKISVGSNTLLQDAKNKVLYVAIKKETPNEKTFVIPVRVVLMSDNSGGAGGGTGGTESPRVVTPDNATPAERQERCKNYLGAKPTLVTNINDSVFSIGSGLSAATSGTGGPALEGNSNSGSVSITIAKNITDVANYNLWKCDGTNVIRYTLTSTVVTGEAGNNERVGPVFSHAMNANGAALDITSAAGKNQLAADVFQAAGNANNGNNVPAGLNFAEAELTKNLQYNTRYTGGNNRTQKCVGGTVWLRLNVVAAFPAANANQYPPRVSDSQFVRLDISNNCWKEYRLRNAGNANYDPQIALGTDVAISGDWAAALAETDSVSTAQQNVGAIYMFKKENGTWVRKGDKLSVPALLRDENITSIDLKGDVLVAGAPKRGVYGAAYVFRRSGDVWSLSHSIASPFTSGTPKFGTRVAINSNYIAIGAPYARAVYLYAYTATTVSSSPITIQDVTKEYFGGSSIVFGGSYIFIGAAGEPGLTNEYVGAVNIYNISTTSPVLYKTFNGSQEMDRFGSNIAVFGNRLAIASEAFKDANGVSVGRVDYYADFTAANAETTASTRNWVGTITNSYIGNGLIISANGIYVSVPNSTLLTPPGLVEYYPFASTEGKTFGNTFRIRASNQEDGAKFGWAMASDGNNIMIGAKNKFDGAADGGAAFIYEAK